MGIRVKWMDDKGNEVTQDKATRALVTTYNEEGKIVDESFGTVESKEEVADQE